MKRFDSKPQGGTQKQVSIMGTQISESTPLFSEFKKISIDKVKIDDFSINSFMIDQEVGHYITTYEVVYKDYFFVDYLSWADKYDPDKYLSEGCIYTLHPELRMQLYQQKVLSSVFGRDKLAQLWSGSLAESFESLYCVLYDVRHLGHYLHFGKTLDEVEAWAAIHTF